MAKHLTLDERKMIEKLYKKQMSPKEIAEILERSERTIYRELKRGFVMLFDTYLREYPSYDYQIAQNKYDEGLAHKGRKPKLVEDQVLCDRIREGILKEKKSPDIIVETLRLDHPGQNICCTKTVYNAIDHGLIPGVTNLDLWVKVKMKKRKYKKLDRIAHSDLRSIEERPESINNREEIGHWELDCIESTKSDPTTLLVLTERSLRKSFMFRMLEKTQDQVIHCLDYLERKFRSKFKKMFRSITMDNGVEFLDAARIEKSLLTLKPRTITYYCHPGRPDERGSNENWNKMVRRFVKKGAKISKYSKNDIKQIEGWINALPRKILGYRSSEDLFQEWLLTL